MGVKIYFMYDHLWLTIRVTELDPGVNNNGLMVRPNLIKGCSNISPQLGFLSHICFIKKVFNYVVYRQVKELQRLKN